MNDYPSKAAVDARRARYAPGTRVELVSMDDPYTTLKPGDRGTVQAVDSIGTVHIAWDCGSTLGAAFGADEIRLLTVIPPIVVEQILKVRLLPGVPNMLSIKELFEFAMELGGFDELCDFLFMDTRSYSNFILTGEREN